MKKIEMDIPVTSPPSDNALPTMPHLQDRRAAVAIPAVGFSKKRSLLDSLAPAMRRFKLGDVLNTRHHSPDFIETRAEYIAVRLRFMIIFYAVVVPLWIPVDYLLLRPEHFMPMAFARLMLAACLLALGLLALRNPASARVHIVLALTIGAPCVFYVAAMLIFHQEVAELAPAGYSFMPFLMVAMLGVFPLTLAWGISLITAITFIQLGLAASLGQLMTADTVDKLWALLMFGGISLWIQSGQLLMLMKLYRESSQDPLTGMINRRVLMKFLAAEIAKSGKGKPSFCILMFDLDRFKRINDSHGHLTGDKVLKVTADLLERGVRKHDIVARFGGEEFVAVLPQSTHGEAIAVAERIRQSIEEAQLTAPNGERIQLSTSVGVTEYEPGEAIEVAIDRADGSLFKAKVLGRNRVVHSQSNSCTEV